MNYSTNEKAMIYNNEVLWARYEIRAFYSRNIVHEICENIAQQLSLLRVQLSMLGEENGTLREKIEVSGELTGQVIREFRHLCKGLDPETEYLQESGFLPTLENELRAFHQNATMRVNGDIRNFTPGTELIVYRMLQELLTLIRVESVTVSYGKDMVDFKLTYSGPLIELNQAQDGRLSLPQRAELLGGQLSIQQNILLTVPF